jgi:hypothetical protein
MSDMIDRSFEPKDLTPAAITSASITDHNKHN